MKMLMIVCALTATWTMAGGELRLSLNSDSLKGLWTVWNQNMSIQVRATVPGGIYTDLQSSGILDANLFYRFNDLDYRWVSRDNWTYQAVFDVPREVLQGAAVNLVFHGLDTVGDVFLNGKFLTSVNNMFVRYVLPIKGLVKETDNILRIQFTSPVHAARHLAEVQRNQYPVPPECTPKSYNGECHVNFLRKMQASFSWDWGPAFPSVGIWKSIEVEAYDLGIIRDVVATPVKLNSTTWMINVTYYVEFADDPDKVDYVVNGSLRKSGGNVGQDNLDFAFVNLDNTKVPDDAVRHGRVCRAEFYVNRESIDLWWPNGFGERTLYDLTLTMTTLDGWEMTAKTVRIGFREVELVQEQIQSGVPGLSFYFRVNGLPIFAKGSNWIPGHVLPELGYHEPTVRHLLQSAKDANMNMIRIWGGGVYESDEFYRIADELGLLIWQDMMFACAMYPTDPDFLANVRLETRQQVRRLQHHPSIALWAGNNENEAALRGNWYGTGKNFSLYKADYVKLYVDTIQVAVLETDESRAYLTSSPTNGLETIEEGYVAVDPYSPLYGDVHYYNYLKDGWQSYTYPDTRFASEYGFQSLPSYRSLSKVSLPADRKVTSEFSAKRQHLEGGNGFLMNLIGKQLPLPPTDSEAAYETFIYYSQVSQAVSTRTETEKYRRDRNKLSFDNRGQTMGAMYWQLNDVWQAPSWSSIEFGGKWKMLHYHAVKFFSPVLVSPERTVEDVINVYVVSDLVEDVPDVRLNLSVYSWASFTPLKTYSSTINLEKASAKAYATYVLSNLMRQANTDPRRSFLYLTVEGPNFFSDNFVYPSPLKDVVNLQKPNLTVRITESDEVGVVGLEVTTDGIAPFVWLDTDERGTFSDNGFTLVTPQTSLMFRSWHGEVVDLDNLRASLTIRSLP